MHVAGCCAVVCTASALNAAVVLLLLACARARQQTCDAPMRSVLARGASWAPRSLPTLLLLCATCGGSQQRQLGGSRAHAIMVAPLPRHDVLQQHASGCCAVWFVAEALR